MKGLSVRYSTGIGNEWCRTPVERQVELNNTAIGYWESTSFIKRCYPGRPFQLEFSARNTVRRWGTCWPDESKIILYRHSAWVLLHELAHFAHLGHGPEFGKELDRLVEVWEEMFDPKAIDIRNRKLEDALQLGCRVDGRQVFIDGDYEDTEALQELLGGKICRDARMHSFYLYL